jgi:hypothetical protein
MKVRDLAEPVPGSIKAICSNCGDEVWVSPKEQAIAQVSKIICLPCLPEPLRGMILRAAVISLIEERLLPDRVAWGRN